MMGEGGDGGGWGRWIDRGGGRVYKGEELEFWGGVMEDLSREQVTALGRAVGLDIGEPELTEVTHNINALLQALDDINPPGLDAIEPLPIVLPPSE